MREVMIGTSAYPSADDGLLTEAGIGWVRQSFRFPFADRVGGEVMDEYRRNKEAAEKWVARGFRVMGVTPLVGIGRREPDAEGRLALRWQDHLPAWCGPLGSDRYVRRTCSRNWERFLCESMLRRPL